MKASSGEKRRRRRERRFLEFYDVLSSRASLLAVAASGAFLAWVMARSLIGIP
jgi:hypothetical protein